MSAVGGRARLSGDVQWLDRIFMQRVRLARAACALLAFLGIGLEPSDRAPATGKNEAEYKTLRTADSGKVFGGCHWGISRTAFLSLFQIRD